MKKATPTHERRVNTQPGSYQIHQWQQRAALIILALDILADHVDRSTARKSGYESKSFSEEDYLDKLFVTGYENTKNLVIIVTFHSRTTAPPLIGFRRKMGASNRLVKLISDRTYWLMITAD